MSQVPVIAIDGPSGSGKGTIARRVASQLGWHLLDSGALYRLVAMRGQHTGLALDDVEGTHGRRRRSTCGSAWTLQCGAVELAGVDVTRELRAEATGEAASGSPPGSWSAGPDGPPASCAQPGLVADGRDMGSIVFRDAAQDLPNREPRGKGPEAL
jgi:cytidylate kinase